MNYFYGGAFNPMTKAHLFIIGEILKELKENEKLIIGITEHDYKSYEFDFNFRANIIIENLKKYYKNYWDSNKIHLIKQDKRTWKFLNQNILKVYSPITLILGEDEYNDLKSLNIWHYSQDILDTFPIKVFSRAEETKNISATKVRKLLEQNINSEELKDLITETTWTILKEQLNEYH